MRILRDISQAKSKVSTLNFRRANFELFKELVSRTLRDSPLLLREQNRAVRSF